MFSLDELADVVVVVERTIFLPKRAAKQMTSSRQKLSFVVSHEFQNRLSAKDEK